MNDRSRRLVRKLACGAFSFGLIATAPLFVGGAQAQTTIVDPNAPKEGMSSHDAALAAARRGDYVGALELSKKAAAEGHPLEADQVDFISGKAEKQQATAADNAALKAKASEASASAQEILARQQKDYAARSKQEQQLDQESSKCDPRQRIGTFTSAAGAAGSTGASSGFGAKVTGADGPKCKG